MNRKRTTTFTPRNLYRRFAILILLISGAVDLKLFVLDPDSTYQRDWDPDTTVRKFGIRVRPKYVLFQRTIDFICFSTFIKHTVPTV
jgi:hypothetical protein